MLRNNNDLGIVENNKFDYDSLRKLGLKKSDKEIEVILNKISNAHNISLKDSFIHFSKVCKNSKISFYTTSFIGEVYGKNSDEYKKKLIFNANCNNCNFDKFKLKNNFTSEEEAKIAFKEKYASNGVKSLMRKRNISLDEAKLIQKQRTDKARETYNKRSPENKAQVNKSKGLSISAYNKKYGEEIGTIKYQEELDKRKNWQSLGWYVKKYGKVLGKEKYKIRYARKNHYWTVEYWEKNGYNNHEARIKLQSVFDKRADFSKKYCIEKYGEVVGIKVWKDRQVLWQKTLANKSPEELERINLLRYKPIERGSKPANKFFFRLYKKLRKLKIIERKDVYFGVGGSSEYFISKKGQRIKFYDFTIRSLRFIIEFNGIAFHPREGDYDWVSAYGITYQEAFNKDNIKKQIAQNEGFDLYEVWEDEDLDEKIEEMILIIMDKSEDIEKN